MQQDKMLSFERGVLYLKLKEVFNIYKMSISCTIARISREEVEVVKADSKGEISSSSMTLSAKEMDLLERGRRMVKEWWDSYPLGEKCVLLECGHVLNWEEWNERMNEYNSHSTYTLPHEGSFYCFECESESPAHRFNKADFEEVAVQG